MSRQNPVEKAQEMLRNGADPEWVRQCTGISLPRIRQIAEDLGDNTPAETPSVEENQEEAISLW